MFDLHTHSTCSDGTLAPAAVVARAVGTGLAGLALTDHDTTTGWREAAAACARHGLRFVPGIELSTEVDGRSVHLLGYWVDGDDPALVAECGRLRDERARRAAETVERLAALGVSIHLERVAAIAGDAPIGRPHVAAALVEAGAVPDLAAAFDRYLADGGPAYVPKRALAPVDGLALIRGAGGVGVLAHPGLPGRGRPITEDLISALARAGLAGLEVEHPGHEPAVRACLQEMAVAAGLLVTGASDFHGDDGDVTIGACATDAATVAALQERRLREGSW